jgi:hypothetical protein
MSTKKISAGDTLTVGDLTDAHLGAEIEVDDGQGVRTRMTLGRIEEAHADALRLFTSEGGYKAARVSRPIKVITPPPVVQPDKPTILGQCIRIKGDDWLGVVADPQDKRCPILDTDENWWPWDLILVRAGDRQIIVSDPPRWPDDTPVVPERIEVGEWPDNDTHLRAWKWIEVDDGYPWWWDDEVGSWRSGYMLSDMRRPLCGPWTRRERVK